MRKLAAALLLVAVGRLASPVAVPVYDGVGQPDEPYKYVGTSKPPAASVSTTLRAAGGFSASLQLKSAESGPQVLLDLGPGSFRATTPTITVTVTPLKGDGTAVPAGTIDGNVYRVTASRGATLDAAQTQGFLYLRAAVMTRPNPVVVHRRTESDPWEQVKTVRAGTDIVSTPFRELGDYAVARVPGSKPLSAGGGLSTTRLLLLGGGVLVLVVLTILVLRRPATEE